MRAEVNKRLAAIAEEFGLELPEELVQQSGGPVERHEQYLLGVAMLLDEVLQEMDVEVESEESDEYSEFD